MKFFKKIFVPVVAAVCALSICFAFAACTDKETENGNTDKHNKYAAEDDDTNWDYTTYVVYLELPDGTPVSNVTVGICSGDLCLPTVNTNEDGRASATFSASQQGQQVYVHFSLIPDSTGMNLVEYEGPDGYKLPANSSTYNDETVWFLTKKVTTLTFVAE